MEIRKLRNKYRSRRYVDNLVKEKGFTRSVLRENGLKVGFFGSIFGNDLGEQISVAIGNVFYEIENLYSDRSFKDISILELGCGANGGNIESKIDKRNRKTMEPWIGRAMYKSGVDYFGIDVGDISNEKFPHKQQDLLNSSLDFFPEGRFDVVLAMMLFNSPELEKRYSGNKSFENASKEAGNSLWNTLYPSLERIIKPEGFFLFSY